MDLLALLTEMIDRDTSDLHLAAGVPPVFRLQRSSRTVDKQVRIDDISITEERHRDGNQRQLTTYGKRILTDDDMAGLASQLPVVAKGFGPFASSRRSAIVESAGRIWRVEQATTCGVPVLTARLLPERVPTMRELFDASRLLTSLIHYPSGIILIAGGMESGKTTTAYALVEQINLNHSRRIVILGMEYPMTSKMSLVSHLVEGIDCSSLAEGLRIAAAMDPNVVLVPDLPDGETVTEALRRAQIALVIATVHAGTARDALRMVVRLTAPQESVTRLRLAGSLQALIAQRLIQRGFEQGRVPAHEILLGQPDVWERIAAGDDDVADMIEQGRATGMCTMDDSVIHLCIRGQISRDSARESLSDPGFLPEV